MYVPPVSFGSRARKRKICSRRGDARHRAVARNRPHGVGCEESRSANPCLRAKASKILARPTRLAADALAVDTAALPFRDQALDVPALGLGEVEQLEQPARLGRVVVGDRRLEVPALGRRLP